MEITEEKLYAAFGLDPNQGGKESEVAEQTEEQEGQQTEDPETELTNEEDGTGENGDTGENQDAGEDGAEESQTEEERRENAARRRQQEQQEAIDRAVRAAIAEQQEQFRQQQTTFFQQAGLVNPFTNQPITNMEEFQAWRDKQDEQKLQKEMASGKLSQETLNKLIDKHPAVQAVREAQAQGEREAHAEMDAAFQQDVERQLTEIRKTDPSVQTVSDLLKRPYSKEFYDAVKRGNNFLDAYYLATRGRVEAAAAEAAKQSAVNNMTGKNHLKPTNFNGKAGATVTPDERKMFKLLNPNATDEEIQRYQNKYKKG